MDRSATPAVVLQAVEELRQTFSSCQESPLGVPNKPIAYAELANARKVLLAILLPARAPEALVGIELEELITSLREILLKAVFSCGECHSESSGSTWLQKEDCQKIVDDFITELPQLRADVVEDIKAAYRGDPAARSYFEVVSAYPGLYAIAMHRVSHFFFRKEVPLLPRILSESVHSETGIDIHPGAKIGRGLFIDHGTGTVIGETTILGENVKIYQGVTLGAKSFPLDEKGNPIKGVQRHPKVGDNVIIYANTTILGADTVVGDGAVIGGNLFLTKSVEANSVITESSRAPL